jgi:hypothetical protein
MEIVIDDAGLLDLGDYHLICTVGGVVVPISSAMAEFLWPRIFSGVHVWISA